MFDIVHLDNDDADDDDDDDGNNPSHQPIRQILNVCDHRISSSCMSTWHRCLRPVSPLVRGTDK